MSSQGLRLPAAGAWAILTRMMPPRLVTPSDLKRRGLPSALLPAAAAGLLALAAVLAERTFLAPAAHPTPPASSTAPAEGPLAAAPPETSRAKPADYERAVDLYAAGRLRESLAILKTMPDDRHVTRARTRIETELKGRRKR